MGFTMKRLIGIYVPRIVSEHQMIASEFGGEGDEVHISVTYKVGRVSGGRVLIDRSFRHHENPDVTRAYDAARHIMAREGVRFEEH
jgi:hypothetical protein